MEGLPGGRECRGEGGRGGLAETRSQQRGGHHVIYPCRDLPNRARGRLPASRLHDTSQLASGSGGLFSRCARFCPGTIYLSFSVKRRQVRHHADQEAQGAAAEGCVHFTFSLLSCANVLLALSSEKYDHLWSGPRHHAWLHGRARRRTHNGTLTGSSSGTIPLYADYGASHKHSYTSNSLTCGHA